MADRTHWPVELPERRDLGLQALFVLLGLGLELGGDGLAALLAGVGVVLGVGPQDPLALELELGVGRGLDGDRGLLGVDADLDARSV